MPKGLSEVDRVQLKKSIEKACAEVLATNQKFLQQRIQQADRDVLKQAVQQGLTAFQQGVKDLLTGCDDPEVAKTVCLVSYWGCVRCFAACAGCYPTNKEVAVLVIG